MVVPGGEDGASGLDQASIALVYDYWLDGEHYTERDRELGDAFAVCAPHMPYLVRSQRDLLGRIVRHLADAGVRQFLDLGSGVPANGHVHEIANAAGHDSRVVYVDFDPRVAELGRDLLADSGSAAFLAADIGRPKEVMASPEVGDLFRLDEPVAVLMLETLLHFPDDRRPDQVVAAYAEAVAAGSYVALSHCSENDQLVAGFEMFEKLMFGVRPEVHLRPPEVLKRYFSGLELLDPGVVPIPLWHPDSDDDVDRNPDQVQMHVGVARKA